MLIFVVLVTNKCPAQKMLFIVPGNQSTADHDLFSRALGVRNEVKFRTSQVAH